MAVTVSAMFIPVHDADEAQQVRMSKSDADNAFWARYKNFAATAEAYCAN